MPMGGRHIFGSGDSAGCFHRMGAVECHQYRSVAAGVIESLTAASSDTTAVVCVDDVHLLDDLSIFVVHQIMQRGAAKLLLTVREGEPIPAAVQEIWKGGVMTRLMRSCGIATATWQERSASRGISLGQRRCRSAGQCPHGGGHDGVGVGWRQSSVPGRPPIHRWPEDEIQRDLGIEVRVQLTACDSAVPDLPHGRSADVHLVCSYPLAFSWVELRLADELGVDRAKWAGVEAHHAAQR
jgi:hypothetical protein